LKLAIIKVYMVDQVACLKHISAEESAVLSYKSRTEKLRRMLAEKRQKQRMKSVPASHHSLAHLIALIPL